MKTFKGFVSEGTLHPKAIHARHLGGGKFKVEKLGHRVPGNLKIGDEVKSADLDDFQSSGYKVKEIH